MVLQISGADVHTVLQLTKENEEFASNNRHISKVNIYLNHSTVIHVPIPSVLGYVCMLCSLVSS